MVDVGGRRRARDSEASMVISSISRIGRLDWSLGGAHRDRVYVCVVSVWVYLVLQKKLYG